MERAFGVPTSLPYGQLRRCFAGWAQEDAVSAYGGPRRSQYLFGLHRWASLAIDESRFRPSGLTQMRSSVLQAITILDGQGRKDYADDVRAQLDKASLAEGPKPAPAAPTPKARLSLRLSRSNVWARGGSGFAVTSAGRVITALHVVEDSARIDVQCGNLSPFRARVVSMSAGNDVAVLEPLSPVATPDHVQLGDSRKVAVGQRVFTVGFPASDVLGETAKYH